MVMRHGYRPESQQTAPTLSPTDQGIPGDLLGCYYCNDVVAPTDVSKLLCRSVVPYALKKLLCISTANIIFKTLIPCSGMNSNLNFCLDTGDGKVTKGVNTKCTCI